MMWFVAGIFLFFMVLYFTAGLDFQTALKDALVSNGMIALAAYGTLNLLRFYQPKQYLRLIYSIGLASGSVYLMRELSPYLISEAGDYRNFLDQTMLIRCIAGWLMISLVSATAWLWTHVNEEQEMEARTLENEKLVREAELSKLRQQLQPHFLFNSLNSISALVSAHPEDARKMIQQLSDFLRGTLKKDDQKDITLSEELDHLKLYLEIEKVRFGHRLKTLIEYEENCLELKLPSLLLQPIVENAIKFGLYDTIGEIVIRLQAKCEGQYLSIQVENPFDPETASPKPGTGFGLTSVQRRLNLLYARNDLLTTKQKNNTFITTIKVPQAA